MRNIIQLYSTKLDMSNNQISKQIYTQFQLNLTEVKKGDYNNIYNDISIVSKVFEQGKLTTEKRMILEDSEIYKFIEFINLLFSGNMVTSLRLTVKIYNPEINKYESMPLIGIPDMNNGILWFNIGSLMITGLTADDLQILKLKLTSYFQDYLKFTTNQIMISLLENIENKLDENSKNEIHHINMCKSELIDCLEKLSKSDISYNNQEIEVPEIVLLEKEVEEENQEQEYLAEINQNNFDENYIEAEELNFEYNESLFDTLDIETNKEMNTELTYEESDDIDSLIQKNIQNLGIDENVLNINELGDLNKLENTEIKMMDQIDYSLLEEDDEEKEEIERFKNELYDNKNIQDIYFKEFPNYKKLMSKLFIISQEPNSQYKFIYEIVYKTYINQMLKPNYTFDEFCKDVFGLSEQELKNKLYQVDYTYHNMYVKQMDDILNKDINQFLNEFVLNINMIKDPVIVLTKNIGSPIIFDIEDKNDEIGNRTFKLLDHPGFKQLHNLSKMILSILNYEYALLYSLCRNTEIDQTYLQELYYQNQIENIDKIRIGLIINILSIIKATSSFVYLTIPPKYDSLVAHDGIIELDKDYSRLLDMLNYRNELINNNFFEVENSYIMDDFKYFIGHAFKFEITKEKFDKLYSINYDKFLDDRFLESYYVYFQMNGINNMYKDIYKINKNDILKDVLLDKLNDTNLDESTKKEIMKLSETVINYQDFINNIENKSYKDNIPIEIINVMRAWDVSFVKDKAHFYSLLNEKFDVKLTNMAGVNPMPDYIFS
jgi:hypothetical protein